MAKLWQKNYDLDKTAEAFTVGDDYVLDAVLIEADVLGSIAHAKMLEKIGVLTTEEFKQLKDGLVGTLEAACEGAFGITAADEDVHTAVENRLVQLLGDLGKKLHTGRSRNDQVLVDTRMYLREQLLAISSATAVLAAALTDFARAHEFVPMPGRTHTQRAMPSSVGLWAGAFAEALADDLALLDTAYALADQCPLGSAASYGVALPLDRELTAELLGFAKVQNNVLYANNSRGKFGAVAVFACDAVMLDLAKLSGDMIWFATPEFGYFRLPDEYCPGSSIMPQKKNPGPLELIRAKASGVAAALVQITGIIRALPSGYNRDLQETKAPLMRALDTTRACLEMMTLLVGTLGVDAERLRASFTPELFAADAAIELAAGGVPFRDAYRQVGATLDKLAARDPEENIRSKTHTGAPGNLGLDALKARLTSRLDEFDARGKRLQQVKDALLAL